ncbi:arginine--tRNA ligase [Candidatus Pelagibacter sp.]|nr:arginine--tRNA ligase [Candidatus Pelagibacter sp.]MDA7574439.1 arginine--tRNA ligase [Candidatus Pelagibacter sp.]MDA9187151.1 arginine--tRNA ligase [Candidatus Pelagibacter sp.]MDC1045269.1 arginine--tRNA ligase [Candidatus Pelagibacter sp.]
MNIFEIYLDKIKSIIVDLNKKGELIIPETLNGINSEIPPAKFDSDISTNVAMVLSKLNKKSPLDLAEKISPIIKENDPLIESITIVKPGFINIKFKPIFWSNFIKEIILNAKTFGINEKEKKLNYLVEFVSANPTGPLHVGHCRGAILGDVISNVLLFNNHKVTKEYYVNDYGNQIINFTKSVYFRIREVKYNETFPSENPDLYPGDYLIDFANNIVTSNKDLNFDKYEDISEKLTALSIEQALLLIKKNLKSLGIKHDSFVSEKKIVQNKEVENVINFLESNNFVYKGKIKAPEGEDNKNWVEREQLLFKSTDFGDDKDRALQKSDGTWTYFASDVAYHKNKVDRKFDYLINILGADHAGYIKRISSSVDALSGTKNKLICKISQLVKLIKDKKPFKMSKRKGDYITVDDLIDEVGKDATRFIMLNRSSDVELDFDFDAVKEKSKDNPLYYVQYCYARISSVFRHLEKDLDKDINIDNYNFEYSYDEIKILKKISEWPKCIDLASSKLEPHRIPIFLYELAAEFHSYWNLGKQFPEKRFINDQKNISQDKLVFLKAIANVIKSGMDIVGVASPSKM